jgi:fucose 4-O-acetylase-like acetyltransferase
MSHSSEKRLRWVDCCKGICIILVVYGHVTGGLVASGVVHGGSAFDRVRNWVYLFHMPAFFFLSGLFASRALGRSLWIVVQNRITALVYPYVLWTGIYLLVQVVMARYANNPPDAGRALHFLWEPYGYGLWFLYSLFLISLLFHLLMLTRMPKEVVLVVAIVLHVAAGFNVFGFWPILNTALLNFVFYAVGGLYPQTAFAWLSGGKPRYLLMTGLFLLGLMTAVALTFGRSKVPIGLMVTLLGVAGVVCLAKGLAVFALGNFLSMLGFYSLEIYLGHALFGTASRTLLSRCGVRLPAPYVISGLLIGLFASLALAVLCQKFKFPFLFRWPTPRRPVTVVELTSA